MSKEHSIIVMDRRILTIPILITALTIPGVADAQQGDRCEDRIGTSRVIELDPDVTSAVGSFQFARLPLRRGEFVLTFDDGPVGPSTRRILHLLEQECVRATFFMLGGRAERDPLVVRRARYAGHTIASHTYSHPDLTVLPREEAEAEIVAGYRAVEAAAYGMALSQDTPRLFRFPNFRSNEALEQFAASLSMAVVSADISPKDWRGDPPRETLARLLKILETNTSGIIVLHDSQMNTARMLPMLFEEMKARGLQVVHIIPKRG